jgi:hypothetical protein
MVKNVSQSFDLHVLSQPTYEDVTVGCVCVHDWALVPEQYDKFYSCSVFHSSSVMGQCWASMNVPAPKKGALQLDPKTCNGNFLKYGCNNFD